MSHVYKICPAALWREAERDGVFRGSEIDRHDGFIHFSTAAQVVETIRRFHQAGTRHVILDFVGPYEERFAEIERFAREALPKLADLRGR